VCEAHRIKSTVWHLDVKVHPATLDQGQVELVEVVGIEHGDPLAARRREYVNEVEQTRQCQLANLLVII
jgi:hypothetical protein